MGELLACVDFSDSTPRVLTAATSLGSDGRFTVRLVHVAAGEPELAGYDREPFEADTPDKRSAQLRGEHTQLEQLSGTLAAAGVAVADPVIVMGHTADEIRRVAGELSAELIMVGSHGHGGLHHLLVGSVTESLLRRSPVPVVVVPHAA